MKEREKDQYLSDSKQSNDKWLLQIKQEIWADSDKITLDTDKSPLTWTSDFSDSRVTIRTVRPWGRTFSLGTFEWSKLVLGWLNVACALSPPIKKLGVIFFRCARQSGCRLQGAAKIFNKKKMVFVLSSGPQKVPVRQLFCYIVIFPPFVLASGY